MEQHKNINIIKEIKMFFVKFVMLALVFGTISSIGAKIANTYAKRANNLKQIKKALKILETKITYTYDMLPDLFVEISEKIKGDIRRNILQYSKIYGS